MASCAGPHAVPVLRTIAFATGVLLAAAGARAAGGATIRELGDAAGDSVRSTAGGVSDDGTVVAGDITLPVQGVEAIRWTPSGGLQRLGFLPGDTVSFAEAVSGNGLVLVGVSSSPQGPDQAFRWTPSGGMQPLGALPGSLVGTYATDVNFDGTVVVGLGDSPKNAVQAWRWTQGGGMQALGDLPGGPVNSRAWAVNRDGSVVVGTGESAAGGEAFRWTAAGGMQGLGDLSGGRFTSHAADVNDDGAVIVGTSESANGPEAFLWSAAGGMTALGDLPGGRFQSSATVVSPDGSTVFGSSFVDSGQGDPGEDFRAFVWDAVHGMRSLEQALSADYGLDLGGWQLRSVAGVSADGRTIVGNGINPAGQFEGFIIVVPEPACVACLGFCGVLAGFRRPLRGRRRDH